MIMKAILKLSASLLFTGIILFLSCSKSASLNGPPPAPQQTMDTLSGREFQFNDLTWREIVSWGTNVIVDIDRPDLFFDPFRELKVKMRHDTSSVWLDVFPETGSYSYPTGVNFFYAVGSDFFYAAAGHLYIYPVPAIHSLIGRKVSIKVKFL
jgi:hypothetical protein